MLSTDEAEHRQRFPDETRDLTLNVEYQSCAPQHAPVVQRIEQRGQESITNAPVHAPCLPEEEGRSSAQTKRSVVNGFRNETRDLTLNVEYQSCAPQHAPVVQRIEQGFPKP